MDITPLFPVQLGSTDLRVSPLGFGTIKFGRTVQVKYPTPVVLPTDGQVRDLLALARDLGINLLDTAPAYGIAEARLGKAIAHNRDDWIVCTKAGEQFDGEHSHFDFSPIAIAASVDASLAALRTDRLDIVLLHSDGDIERTRMFDDALGSLNDLRDRGKVRAFGASTKTVAGGERAAELSDIVMVTLNPNQTDDLEVVGCARERGVGVLVKKAFSSGHMILGNSADCERKPALDPVVRSLSFVFGTPGIHSVVVGTTNPDHLRKNVQAASAILADKDRTQDPNTA